MTPRQVDREGNELRTRQRVVYVGMLGTMSEPGRVSRVLKASVRVRFDDGRVEDVHPEGLRRSAPIVNEPNGNSSFVPKPCDFWDRSTQTGRK
ncbi:hypothetical protein KNU09_gp48 [Gordonia phage TillyBobJoe]|uniref:Uncharacterized protein n=2 Tax=Wizardvirus TaxID=2169658 RepID=A0A5P8DA57_9CAUD|nr:hypothetical protein KNU09_gp48 [Gordonia phage TillyBobJoe]YP_010104263.1 hypothetical protein KNU74_gp49 [Gordonia phage Fireball]AXQ62325.1 hypothetical protein SEA_TILLYBOBJOE_48 [Gordonia phage TillyBobJoe]QFP95874.1 hypothetical protein SEA_FIREBALL_49 [Gordonia phage Fireball]